jgi:hypothetical protein
MGDLHARSEFFIVVSAIVKLIAACFDNCEIFELEKRLLECICCLNYDLQASPATRLVTAGFLGYEASTIVPRFFAKQAFEMTDCGHPQSYTLVLRGTTISRYLKCLQQVVFSPFNVDEQITITLSS